MERYLADTHAIIWYVEDRAQLGKRASAALDGMRMGDVTVYLSLMSLMEMDYLVRKRKISPKLHDLLLTAAKRPNSALQILDIDHAVYAAFLKTDPVHVPDLPDRVIVATALAHRLPLITKDRKITAYPSLKTVW